MNLDSVFSISAVNKKRQSSGGVQPPAIEPVVQPPGSAKVLLPQIIPAHSLMPARAESANLEETDQSDNKHGFMLPFDPLRAVHSLWENLIVCLACGAALGCSMFCVARILIEPSYMASAQLIKQAMPDSFRASQIGESYKPHDIPVPILTNNLMRSRSLIERVAKITTPKMSADDLLKGLVISTDRKTEVIDATFTSSVSAARAVTIVACYAHEVVKLTQDLQAHEASEANDFLKRQITRCDAEMEHVSEEMLQYAKVWEMVDGEKEMDAYLSERGNFDLKYEGTRLDYETLDLKIQAVEKELAKVSPVTAKLQKAKEDLAALLGRYTEQNPIVEEQRDHIKVLEEQIKLETAAQQSPPPQAGDSPIAASLYLQRLELMSQKSVFAEQLQKLDDVRNKLTEKLNKLPRKNLEFAMIKARRQSLEAARQLLAGRQREAELFMENSLGYFRVLQNARVEDAVLDKRTSKKLIYGAAAFVAGFIAMALWFISRELGDGLMKTAADMRRITRLPVLAALPDDVGKDRTAQEAWAFRTWTRLHSKLKRPNAAIVCGLLAEAETEHCTLLGSLLADAAAWRGAAVIIITPRPPLDRPSMALTDAVTNSLSEANRWLDKGSGVAYLHTNEDWIWSAEQRNQLINALGIWGRNEQAIIFIELPPASQPETLLMAEQLPQLLWVGASGQRPGIALSETLATYRHAGCKLLGGLLNHAPRLKPAILSQLAGSALCVSFALFPISAQSAEPPPILPLEAISADAAARPELKAKSDTLLLSKSNALTLGAGDTVNIVMYGQPESIRKDIAIKPDGRITYMQAQDIVAAGLTIDQIRSRLNDELTKYYQHPRVIVTPAAFQSRKVYILGKVVKKGMVNYDRPLTLLEAVTEAGGLETGLFQQNTVELADLRHSFLSRRGQRQKVDFEALFQKGDMSQNAALEPDDYIYFPSANANEIYILGNVRSQGTQGLLAQSSVTSAITLAGGFTHAAFRDRVLVIRGSLDKPETFVVDMNAVLSGRKKGFKLEPNDIVYVSNRPWTLAENLLDLALTTFIQGAVTGYVTGNIPALITKPFITPSR